jgi:hypothetical protein
MRRGQLRRSAFVAIDARNYPGEAAARAATYAAAHILALEQAGDSTGAEAWRLVLPAIERQLSEALWRADCSISAAFCDLPAQSEGTAISESERAVSPSPTTMRGKYFASSSIGSPDFQ